jgi:hypothetical protein
MIKMNLLNHQLVQYMYHCAKELPDGDVKWRILPVRFSGADCFFFFCLFVGGGQPTPMQYEALLHPLMSQ